MPSLHVLLADSTSVRGTTNLFHTMRQVNGSWDPLGDVMIETGPAMQQGQGPYQLLSFTCTVDNNNGDLHVLALGIGGTVWHTIRNAAGFWTPWGFVSAVVFPPPQPMISIESVAAAFSRL